MKKKAPIMPLPPRPPSGFSSGSDLVPVRRKDAPVVAPAPAANPRHSKPDRRTKSEGPYRPETRPRPTPRVQSAIADAPVEREQRAHIKAEPKPVMINKNDAAPRVFSAEFALGVTTLKSLPEDDLPQLAFFGRSNVGKSSLLAALMGKKGLVKISASPGKTREINFFRVNGAFYFVDLPGIGYAKVSISKRDEMADMIKEYVEGSTNLRGILYLVDMRLCGTPLDISTVETLRGLGKPVLIVACKRDKLNQGQAAKAAQEIQRRFDLEEPPLEVSALQKTGFDALWEQIFSAIAVEDPMHGR